ncbi:MAG: hypothetical protein ACOC22_03200 [bacterium]
MCHKIESSFALIHLLKDKESCTIKEIVTIKRKIEREIPSVYVDASKHSILETVSSYPEIFSWEKNRIKRKETALDYFHTDAIDFFNNNLEKSIEAKVIQCFEIDD